MTDPNQPPTTVRPTRAEQRRRTESRILGAARRLFAERGYDRTTIRAVAAASGVDAGLVMHYFRSKDELFAHAAKLPPDDFPTGAPQEVAEALLASLGKRLAAEPVASLAVLRSMLTHSEAAAGFREAAGQRLEQMQSVIPAADAELRAGLVSAIITGVIIERYLVRVGHLADAPPESIIDLLRPCFQALTGAPTPPTSAL